MKTWVTDTLVRAIKTAAQALVGLMFGNQTSIVHASFGADLTVAGMAALACVLHNIQSMPLGSSDDIVDTAAIDAAIQSQGAPTADAPNVPAATAPVATTPVAVPVVGAPDAVVQVPAPPA